MVKTTGTLLAVAAAAALASGCAANQCPVSSTAPVAKTENVKGAAACKTHARGQNACSAAKK